jgi:hypothetical protein
MTSETDLEREFGRYVKVRGGLYLKQNALLYPKIPDRLALVPGGRAFFLEWKMPGEEPDSGQLKWARRATARGHCVHWSDNIDYAIRLFETYMAEGGP